MIISIFKWSSDSICKDLSELKDYFQQIFVLLSEFSKSLNALDWMFISSSNGFDFSNIHIMERFNQKF